MHRNVEPTASKRNPSDRPHEPWAHIRKAAEHTARHYMPRSCPPEAPRCDTPLPLDSTTAALRTLVGAQGTAAGDRDREPIEAVSALLRAHQGVLRGIDRELRDLHDLLRPWLAQVAALRAPVLP